VGIELSRASPYLLYAGTSLALCAATVGKIGGATNYLLEPWLALLMWSVYALRYAPGRAPHRPIALVAATILALACVADLATARTLQYSWVDPETFDKRTTYYAMLREEVESLGFDNPSVLSFFIRDDNRNLLIFGQSKTYMITDQASLNDPFLYSLLWEDDILEIEPLVGAIKARWFDLILIPKNLRQFFTRGALPHPYKRLLRNVRANYRLGLAGHIHHYYVRPDHVREDQRVPVPASDKTF
jgi:hypothetical protein